MSCLISIMFTTLLVDKLFSICIVSDERSQIPDLESCDDTLLDYVIAFYWIFIKVSNIVRLCTYVFICS